MQSFRHYQARGLTLFRFRSTHDLGWIRQEQGDDTYLSALRIRPGCVHNLMF